MSANPVSPCSVCPRKYSPIPGDGPQPAPILLIGERPGENEHKYRRVFIGKTGQELDETYLPLAGLRRQDIRVTNAVLCWADHNRTPSEKERSACVSHHIPQELRQCDPDLLVLMGGTACKMIPEIQLETHHGVPRKAELSGWRGWVVPMYHPALGLHESRWMTQLLEDWERLGKYLNGSYSPPKDQVPPHSYNILETPADVDGRTGLKARSVSDGQVSIDTEDHGGVPWSIQFSYRPNSGFLIRAENKAAIQRLGYWIKRQKCEVVLHNAVHDIDICEKLGLQIDRFRDTMQEAYHQGNLPQGLKALVYRLFGVTMTSWEDVVRPYSIEELMVWLVEVEELAKVDLSLLEVKRLKTKVKEIVKRGPLEQLVSRLIQHTDVKSEYDPWQRLSEFWTDDANEWMTSHVESRLGKYPILGIANAPLNRAVEYAVGDADWTGQVARKLREIRESGVFEIGEGDRDYEQEHEPVY